MGPFRLVGRIGSGGMGSVFAARPPEEPPANRYLAIKLVHSAYAADPDFRARFAREVDLVRRVTGPCVPAFLGADPNAETPWLATEFVTGEPLNRHLKDNGPLAEPMLSAFAIGIAEALRAIHATGIVHRDLKPGNVILAPDGPKVLDFGIARAVDETALTRTGGVVGTPGWIAPEQLQSSEPGPPADMFAWGCLVAQAARDEHPFGSGAGNTLTYRVLREEPDLTGVPDQLLPLVTGALAKEPAQRPTAEQAVGTISGQFGAPPPQPEQEPATVGRLLHHQWHGIPERTPTPPPRPRRRWPWMAAAAGAALFLVLGLGAAGAHISSYAPWVTGEDATVAGDGADEGEAADGGGTGEAELPPEAVEEAVNPQSQHGARIDENDDGDPQIFLRLFYHSDTVTGAVTMLSLTEVEQTAEGLTIAAEASWGGGDEIVVSEHNFPIITDGDEFTPTEGFEFDPSMDDQQEYFFTNDSMPFTLTYPDAPDSGLLTFRDVDEEYPNGTIPSVGVCYDVDEGFHTDYASCV